MNSHFDRHVGRQFEKSNRSDRHVFRGHQRPGFFSGHHGHHRFGGHRQQPTAEQRALRNAVAEVAQLFVIAARTSRGNAEQQAQLRAVLERSRKELSALVYESSQQPQQTTPEDKTERERA